MQLSSEQISKTDFLSFNRYQEVTRCWRRVDGEWVIKPIEFIDDWSAEEKELLITLLTGTVDSGGIVIAAFNGAELLGFASVEYTFFGSGAQYLQLSSLHTAYEHRGKGIGRQLFFIAAESARDLGAEKLYISAHSAVETQAFYKSVGCVEAAEVNEALVEKEPVDCQLEFDLRRLK